MAIMTPGRTVRVRAPRATVLARYGYVLPGLATMTLPVWLGTAETWMWVVWGVLVVLLGVAVAEGLWRPNGVDLREDVAVLVDPFRRREIPWRDVQAITMGSWTDHHTTLHLASGRTVRCAYPCRSLFARRRVEADYHRVGQWWLSHRGPDWRPVVAPPPPYPAPQSWPVAGPRPVEEVWRTPPEAQR